MRDIFPRLFGNDATKARIGNAILTSHVPHAFLIDGGAGSGKMTLAKEISAALCCANKNDERYPLPCAVCPSCKRILGDGHVDVHTLVREAGRATIGVEPIRELRRDMFLSATEAEYKVYIISDAEALTPAAQNALLIALEEPPKNVVIMLLASGTDKILTTVKSRAQYIAMSRFKPDEIREYLITTDRDAERVSRVDPDGFEIATASADGRIGMAMDMLKPDRRESLAEERSETIGILRAVCRSGSYADIYSALSAMPSKSTDRQELSLSLERIMLAISDLIKHKEGSVCDMLFFRSEEEAEDTAGTANLKKLFKLYDIVSRAYNDNTKNANISALLASLGAELRMA